MNAPGDAAKDSKGSNGSLALVAVDDKETTRERDYKALESGYVGVGCALRSHASSYSYLSVVQRAIGRSAVFPRREACGLARSTPLTSQRLLPLRRMMHSLCVRSLATLCFAADHIVRFQKTRLALRRHVAIPQPIIDQYDSTLCRVGARALSVC
jgi:hypothetical protein